MQYQLVVQNRRIPAKALAAFVTLVAVLILATGYWLGSLSFAGLTPKATVQGPSTVPVVTSHPADPYEGSNPSSCGNDCGNPAVPEPGS